MRFDCDRESCCVGLMPAIATRNKKGGNFSARLGLGLRSTSIKQERPSTKHVLIKEIKTFFGQTRGRTHSLSNPTDRELVALSSRPQD
jgi:hypothetical protein